MFEKEYAATTIVVTRKCDCGGEFKMDKYGSSLVRMIDPPQYPHTCSKCGLQEYFRKTRIEYRSNGIC